MTQIISRLGYCQLCANSRKPRTGQEFLAYGSTSQKYKVLEANRNGMIGYVPHIYKGKVNGENVIVEKSCAMRECGVDKKLKEDGAGKYWEYYVVEFKREIWTLDTWSALIVLKNNIFTKQFSI